jgi:multiple sugar transport system ATP-binding protein
MVFQSYALYPQMSVEGNLSFGLKNARMPKDEIKSRVERAAKILQIEPLLNRKPGALSGGQRQRVAIGRALVRDVDVFLFDEPLSNLDAKLRVDLRVELKLLHQRLKNTMIYVTHDQIEAMSLADRIAIMKGGKIMQLGTPNEIYNHPKNLYVADFIGSPSMNFLNGELKDTKFTNGSLELPMGSYQFIKKTNLKNVTIGIRPEHIITGELSRKAPVITNVTINLVEPMGSDTLVYANLSDVQIRIRMEGNAKVKIGDRLEIGIDPSRASLFDTQTEQRI